MAVLADLAAVSLRHGDRPLFADLSLTVTDGERVGVVGINGTGKSTLLRVIAGLETPDSGEVRRGRSVRVGYLGQEAVPTPGTVGDAVGRGWEAEAILDRLGMLERSTADVSQLSGGEAKRVALAATLLHPAEMLILDEPTNHLDLRAIAWVEGWLRDYRGGLVLVTHDRHLLDRVTNRILELDRGRSYAHEGGYSSYLAAQVAREEGAASSEATRRNLARRELAWLRRGAPARTRKPQARVDAALAIVTGRPEPAARQGEMDLAFRTPRLGDMVLECAGVGYAYPTSRPSEPLLLHDVDLTLDPRERLGIVGANGSGKSTLLDLLAGRRRPTAGRIDAGPTVVVGYYDQHGSALDLSAPVRDLVAGPTRVPGTPEDNALMDRFWFSGSLQFAPAGTLSGGERKRLQLLLVLAARPNVLLLDEPTNDLDIDTLRILEDYLEEWPGAVVVVSHDRTFLTRVTERVVEVSDGSVRGVPGGLDAWIETTTAAPRAARERAAAARTARPAPGQPARRSPSTLGRLLRDADKELAKLTAARDALLGQLEAAGGDYVELTRIGKELATAQAALDRCEERWLALAEESER